MFVKSAGLSREATLTGWLKNGQVFIGEDKIRVVLSLAFEDASCRRVWAAQDWKRVERRMGTRREA